MGRHLAIAMLCVAAGCLRHAQPKDLSIETAFPAHAAAPTLPRTLQVVTFNVHGQTAARIVEAIRRDRWLREADVIVLEEIHRDETTSTPCSAACGVARELGFYGVYA